MSCIKIKNVLRETKIVAFIEIAKVNTLSIELNSKTHKLYFKFAIFDRIGHLEY